MSAWLSQNLRALQDAFGKIAAQRAGVPGLEMPKLQRVFLTHLHSDHTLGLADLPITP